MWRVSLLLGMGIFAACSVSRGDRAYPDCGAGVASNGDVGDAADVANNAAEQINLHESSKRLRPNGVDISVYKDTIRSMLNETTCTMDVSQFVCVQKDAGRCKFTWPLAEIYQGGTSTLEVVNDAQDALMAKFKNGG